MPAPHSLRAVARMVVTTIQWRGGRGTRRIDADQQRRFNMRSAGSTVRYAIRWMKRARVRLNVARTVGVQTVRSPRLLLRCNGEARASTLVTDSSVDPSSYPASSGVDPLPQPPWSDNSLQGSGDDRREDEDEMIARERFPPLCIVCARKAASVADVGRRLGKPIYCLDCEPLDYNQEHPIHYPERTFEHEPEL